MTLEPGQVERARATRILGELDRRGVKLRRSGSEFVGPCPVCGGEDRFAVNPRKNVFCCRRAGAGGDAIAMVQYLDGCSFPDAVELLAGKGSAAPRRQAAPVEDTARRDAENVYRQREIDAARRIWEGAGDRRVADSYLAWRRIAAPKGAKIRGAAVVPYYARLGEEGRSRVIYEGPAMVAAIVDGAGRFCGAHLTWIDLRILIEGFAGKTSGKAQIVNPETGEIEPAKKVRGSARGGHIPLGGPAEPTRLVVGEGIETTLSVADVMIGAEGEALLEACAFWSAVSLGNLGGKALSSVVHPSLRSEDRNGRMRRARVPGPYPRPDAGHQLEPPASVTDIVTLGDGDSDRFTAELHHARARARWSRPGREIRTAWAPEGMDFNDVLRSGGEAGA